MLCAWLLSLIYTGVGAAHSWLSVQNAKKAYGADTLCICALDEVVDTDTAENGFINMLSDKHGSGLFLRAAFFGCSVFHRPKQKTHTPAD